MKKILNQSLLVKKLEEMILVFVDQIKSINIVVDLYKLIIASRDKIIKIDKIKNLYL